MGKIKLFYVSKNKILAAGGICSIYPLYEVYTKKGFHWGTLEGLLKEGFQVEISPANEKQKEFAKNELKREVGIWENITK